VRSAACFALHASRCMLRAVCFALLQGERTSQNANCPQFTLLHRNGAHGKSERPNVFSGTDLVVVVAVDQITLETFATCTCYR